jgi:hypothetical protein
MSEELHDLLDREKSLHDLIGFVEGAIRGCDDAIAHAQAMLLNLPAEGCDPAMDRQRQWLVDWVDFLKKDQATYRQDLADFVVSHDQVVSRAYRLLKDEATTTPPAPNPTAAAESS